MGGGILEDKPKSPYAHLSWKYYGVWRCMCTVKCFFVGRKPPKPETNTFSDLAETLMSNVESGDVAILDKSKELIKLQREVENTRARRRLERWACKIIVLYLVFVFLLILLNGLSQIYFKEVFRDHGFISDTVMTVILSTTTVNIIGLGVIILRGHFDKPEKKSTTDKKRKTKRGHNAADNGAQS